MHNWTSFCFRNAGAWRVDAVETIAGPGLEIMDAAMEVVAGAAEDPRGVVLRGVQSNIRYSTTPERAELLARQEGLGRPHATCAALIPISKNDDWWKLAQDERRAIFEEQSKHHTIGRDYLPQISRRLYHARDLGEPFDFLTWFEYAPGHQNMFEDLLDHLRASREWTYVSREVDIRLTRAG